jgi:hypothetical protein
MPSYTSNSDVLSSIICTNSESSDIPTIVGAEVVVGAFVVLVELEVVGAFVVLVELEVVGAFVVLVELEVVGAFVV